jgi:D-glycero-D-manno-heptose 1,7-bisphosphate phosphatase
MKLIILDRDGVINYDSDAFIKTPDEWQPIPGSLEAIARLNANGFIVAIASNQSGIGRKLISLENINKIHEKMINALAKVSGHIDSIHFCPHLPEENCVCRKPKTGLLEAIAKQYQTTLQNVPVIGDAWRDLEAAQSVYARPILVLTGKGKKTFQEHQNELNNIDVYENLAAAVDVMIQFHE